MEKLEPKTKLQDLINFERINLLLEGFNKATGFVTAILDLEGNILSKSGWRQICTEFHRVNPETAKKCTKSDTELAGKLSEGERSHCYNCLNGLVDIAVPIIIEGEHIANLFTGQFFYEKPDIEFFRKQANKYGFDEKAYLLALEKVPIFSESQANRVIDFLQNMTALISETALQNHKQIELNKSLQKGEEKLLEIKSLLSETENIAKIGGWTFDVETMEQTWTDEVYRIHEVDKSFSATVNKGIEFYTPSSRPIIEEVVKKAIEKGESYDVELEIITAKGNKRWVHSIGYPHIKNGKTIKISGSFQDITDRKLGELKLKESENKLRALINNLDAGVVVHAADTSIILNNPRASELLGLSDAQLRGKKAFDPKWKFLDKNNNPLPMDDYPVNQVVKNKKVIKDILIGVVRPETNDIVWLMLNGFPFFNAQGALNEVIISFIDITELKQLNDDLKQSEEKFRNLFEFSPLGKSMTGIDGSLKVNHAFCKMLGYTENELKSMHWKEITHPDDIQKSEEIVQNLIDGKIEKAEYVKRYVHKNGSIIWTDISTFLKRDSTNKPEFFITSVRDITELKKHRDHLEELVKERTADLEAKNKELDNAMKVFVGRELTIRNLQEKIRVLEGK